MTPPITDFRLDAIHSFQIRTLTSLGYRTRVALSNSSHERPELATDYRVDVTVFDPTGARARAIEGVAHLATRKKVMIDCEQFVGTYDRDVELVFHLIPLRLAPAAKDGLVAVTREELFFLFTVQDHYVEYYRDDGFASGVLYQSGAFNYGKFSKDATTIIQAPKGYVSADLDTLVSLMNSSLDPSYRATARIRCNVQGDGISASWVEDVPAFQPVLLSLRDRVAGLGIALGDAPRFACFFGLCETATLIPLTISRDLRTGCIGIEHSLPPVYYGTAVTGKQRAHTVASLARLARFEP
jgi:hypothetical protein